MNTPTAGEVVESVSVASAVERLDRLMQFERQIGGGIGIGYHLHLGGLIGIPPAAAIFWDFGIRVRILGL
jgi:hypothetical protein